MSAVLAGMRLPSMREGRALRPSSLDYSAPPFGRFRPLGGRFVASVLGTPLVEPTRRKVLSELPIAAPGSSAPKATPVTVQPDGSYAGSTVSSSYPKISADGRWVAFLSASTELDPRCAKKPDGTTPCGIQVYVRDLLNGATELVSVTQSGGVPNASSFGPTISADGRFVAWHSASDNTVLGVDAPDASFGKPEGDVFLRDRVLRRTERITVRNDGSELNGANASISADGRMVAFDADFEHRTNRYSGSIVGDTYVKDRQTGDVTLASIGNAGQRGNHDSRGPLISPDGGYVVFWSRATNLADRLNPRAELFGRLQFPWGQVYVYDIKARRLSLECVTTDKAQANDACWGYNISAGGRYSIFWSTATNLVPASPQLPNPDQQVFNLYLRDRVTGELEVVNVTSDEDQIAENWPREAPYVRGGKRSPQPYLSWDGSIVAFDTDVALVREDANALVDAYIRDRTTGTTIRMSEAPAGIDPNGWSQWPSLSANGSVVSFISAADNLAPGDDHDGWDVFVRRWRR